MRGDEKYSVGCIEGEWRAGLFGPGEASAEALRLPWPGLRYENMFDGAMRASCARGTCHRALFATPGCRRRRRRAQQASLDRALLLGEGFTPLGEATD
jgi:hypothetical protein